MIFKSKIDFSFTALFIIPFIIILVIAAISLEWLLLLLVIPIYVLTIPIFLNTSYTVTTDGKLIIVSGWLYRKSLDIHTIRKVIPTSVPLSSPALSFNKLEIFYNKFDSVMISPREKQTFLETIISLNPTIET